MRVVTDDYISPYQRNIVSCMQNVHAHTKKIGAG